MPETDDIHRLIQSEEDFDAFIAKVNDQGSFYEIFTAVERTGIETEQVLEQTTIDEIDHFMLGWMRLLWEAHRSHPKHTDDDPGLLELLFFPQY